MCFVQSKQLTVASLLCGQVKGRNSDDDGEVGATIAEVREAEIKYFNNHLTLRGCHLAGTAALARRLNEIQSQRLLKTEIVETLRDKVRILVKYYPVDAPMR